MRRTTGTICFILFLLSVFPWFTQLLAVTISVDVDQVLDPVNPLIFGNAQPFGHGDFLFEPGSSTFDPQALSLISALKPTILRFPGGIHADEYFWEDGIGPRHLRPAPRPGQNESFGFDYGIDEHMALCEQIGAQALITVNYGSGLLGDSLSTQAPLAQRVARAAGWVEYCNSPNDGSNPNGDVDWAVRRAENGHPEPYGIKFWEIGNEIYGEDATGHADVETYAQDLTVFSRAMKAVDPEIKIGGVGVIIPHGIAGWDPIPLEWNATLLEIAHQDMDFLVVHAHYPGQWNLPDRAEDFYRAGLAGANQALTDLTEIRRIIDQVADSSIGIVPGENGFTGGSQYGESPASLLAGLHLADLWMRFLEQSSALNISFACGWLLQSPVYGGDIGCKWTSRERFARPEYYAQMLFREHFGDILVANSLDCGTFSCVRAAKVPAMSDVPELSVCTSIDSTGTSLYLMVVNKQLDKDVPVTIHVSGFEPQPQAHIWTLNGPSIWANNEDDPNTVTVVPSTLAPVSTSFIYTFPAHSLTVMEIKGSLLDTSAPTISHVTVAEITGSSAKVGWQTNKPADSMVEYGPELGDYQSAVEDPELTREHLISLELLESETRYKFRVVSSDSLGNTAASNDDVFRTLDVTPPLISQMEVTDITETAATICWQTDEPADSWVEYSQVDGPLHALMDSSFTGDHLIPLVDLQAATSYSFQASSTDPAGNSSEPQEGSFFTSSPRSEVPDPEPSEKPLLSNYKLWQNYPNPFNGPTNIRYHLSQEAPVTIRIYNPLGQLVKTLVEEEQPPGEYSVSWDAKDGQGQKVASGVYFCSLETGDFREVCKMTLLR